MKNLIILLSFILTSITCYAQTVNGTFQGEVEGVSTVIIHLKADDGLVEGFYKYVTDSVVVFIKGNLDNAGNLSMTGVQDPYPVIEAKLNGRLVEGTIVLPNNRQRHTFYAVDFRGEYSDQYFNDYLRLFLTERGYILQCLSPRHNEELISTFRSEGGLIGLRADSLKTTMYLHSDTLVVDTSHGLPLFMSPYAEHKKEGLSFTTSEEFWSSDSFIEFPEKDEHFNPEGRLLQLNGTTSVRLTQIPRSEYILGKWTAPRNVPYKAVTDFTEAQKLLGEKMKRVEKYDPVTGELLSVNVDITYNDGTIKTVDWLYDFASYPEIFYAYFPELDILVLESEGGGDEVIDFNSRSFEHWIGNPAQTATSPNGEWRITGYYPGGAADTYEWRMECWNTSLKKYELALDLRQNYRGADESVLQMPSYLEGWLWINNHIIVFESLFPEGCCYKLELIHNPANHMDK